MTRSLPVHYSYLPLSLYDTPVEEEIDKKMVSHLDLKTQIVVSGLNKYMKKLLPNEHFFNILQSRFPCIPNLEALPKLFTNFCQHHSVSYIKGICFMMCTKNDEKIPLSVFVEAASVIFTNLKLKMCDTIGDLIEEQKDEEAEASMCRQEIQFFEFHARSESLKAELVQREHTIQVIDEKIKIFRSVENLVQLQMFVNLITQSTEATKDVLLEEYRKSLISETNFIKTIQHYKQAEEAYNKLNNLATLIGDILFALENLGYDLHSSNEKLTEQDLTQIADCIHTNFLDNAMIDPIGKDISDFANIEYFHQKTVKDLSQFFSTLCQNMARIGGDVHNFTADLSLLAYKHKLNSDIIPNL